MKKIDIQGKDYIMVNERLKHFREHYLDHRLISEIYSIEDGVVIFKATVLDPNGEAVASGHAYEKEGSGFINKTSYIENCETSAWGRALANFGIGIDTSVASAEEVGNAIVQQGKGKKKSSPKPQPPTLVKEFVDKTQVTAIFTEAEKFGVSGEDADEMVKSYRKGERLLAIEAAEIIADFGTIYAQWQAELNAAENGA